MASPDNRNVEKTDGVVADHHDLVPAQTHESSGRVNVPVERIETHVLEEQYHMSFRTYVVVACMGLTWGTATLANVGPSSTYSHAVAELGGASISSWIPNAALFPIIGLIPVWGVFSDRFGKKWFIVAGGLFGIVGNIVAGTAKHTVTIVIGQALNGTGSSLLQLVIPASMEIVSAQSRGFAQGGMGMINGSMAIMGLVVAGAFAKMGTSGWRWVFYFNAIFFAVCAVLIGLLYRPPPTKLRRENDTIAAIRSVDYIGIVLFLIGAIGIVVSLTWGGNAYPWSSSRVIALLVLGLVFLIAFGLYETYGRNDGLVHHEFLKDRNFPLILSVGFVDGMLLYGVNAFLPVEASAIFTSDAVRVNVYLLPLNVLVLVGIFVSAYVLGKTKRYRSVLVGSVFLIAVFCGLLALVTPSRVAMCLVFTGLIGLGVGVTTVIPPVILTYAVPSHLFGTAGTLLSSVRALGGTVGITIFASIFSNEMARNLAPGVGQAAVKAGLPAASMPDFLKAFLGGETAALSKITGVTPAVLAAAAEAVKVISAQSFRYVWIANMAIAVATGILCLFLRDVKAKMTSHIESALEHGRLREKQQQHV